MAEEQKPMGDKSAGQRAYEHARRLGFTETDSLWSELCEAFQAGWEAIAQAAAPTSEGAEQERAQEIVRRYRKEISDTPALLSLLYDADLLPEQIVSVRAAVCMAAVCVAYKAGREAHPAVSQAGGQAPTSPPEMREEIARIIDPTAFGTSPAKRRALAKADAVLAALKGGA